MLRHIIFLLPIFLIIHVFCAEIEVGVFCGHTELSNGIQRPYCERSGPVDFSHLSLDSSVVKFTVICPADPAPCAPTSYTPSRLAAASSPDAVAYPLYKGKSNLAVGRLAVNHNGVSGCFSLGATKETMRMLSMQQWYLSWGQLQLGNVYLSPDCPICDAQTMVNNKYSGKKACISDPDYGIAMYSYDSMRNKPVNTTSDRKIDGFITLTPAWQASYIGLGHLSCLGKFTDISNCWCTNKISCTSSNNSTCLYNPASVLDILQHEAGHNLSFHHANFSSYASSLAKINIVDGYTDHRDPMGHPTQSRSVNFIPNIGKTMRRYGDGYVPDHAWTWFDTASVTRRVRLFASDHPQTRHFLGLKATEEELGDVFGGMKRSQHVIGLDFSATANVVKTMASFSTRVTAEYRCDHNAGETYQSYDELGLRLMLGTSHYSYDVTTTKLTGVSMLSPIPMYEGTGYQLGTMILPRRGFVYQQPDTNTPGQWEIRVLDASLAPFISPFYNTTAIHDVPKVQDPYSIPYMDLEIHWAPDASKARPAHSADITALNSGFEVAASPALTVVDNSVMGNWSSSASTPIPRAIIFTDSSLRVSGAGPDRPGLAPPADRAQKVANQYDLSHYAMVQSQTFYIDNVRSSGGAVRGTVSSSAAGISVCGGQVTAFSAGSGPEGPISLAVISDNADIYDAFVLENSSLGSQVVVRGWDVYSLHSVVSKSKSGVVCAMTVPSLSSDSERLAVDPFLRRVYRPCGEGLRPLPAPLGALSFEAGVWRKIHLPSIHGSRGLVYVDFAKGELPADLRLFLDDGVSADLREFSLASLAEHSSARPLSLRLPLNEVGRRVPVVRIAFSHSVNAGFRVFSSEVSKPAETASMLSISLSQKSVSTELYSGPEITSFSCPVATGAFAGVEFTLNGDLWDDYFEVTDLSEYKLPGVSNTPSLISGVDGILPCEPGKYWDNSSMLNCPVGHACSGCVKLPCLGGRWYQPAAGKAACILCTGLAGMADGEYVNTVCTKLPKARASDLPKWEEPNFIMTGDTSPSACPTGYVYNADAESCLPVGIVQPAPPTKLASSVSQINIFEGLERAYPTSLAKDVSTNGTCVWTWGATTSCGASPDPTPDPDPEPDPEPEPEPEPKPEPEPTPDSKPASGLFATYPASCWLVASYFLAVTCVSLLVVVIAQCNSSSVTKPVQPAEKKGISATLLGNIRRAHNGDGNDQVDDELPAREQTTQRPQYLGEFGTADWIRQETWQKPVVLM